MKNILKKINIVRASNKSSKIFENLFEDKTFLDIEYSKPSEYVTTYWNKFKMIGPQTNAINGLIFEYIIATLFVRENILPFYLQAKVAFVPNADFDNLIYSKQFGPISFSMKTTLRERYKQADLEAVALKYVHRKAKCYLLTLDDEEHDSVNIKIKNGDIIGLDKAILCTSTELDDLINYIKSIELSLAGTVDVITCNQIIDNEIINKIK
jgi:hypothetical protein